MKKLMVIIPLLILFLIQLKAQDYTTAVGGRLGSPLSASIKHFITDNHALEAFVGTRGYSYYRWTNISAAYQVHNALNSGDLPDELRWYYGFGGSVFFWSWDEGFYRDRYSSSTFGIQGYIGLDYEFENIPLNITLDWVPTFFLNGFGSGFGAGYGSVGVRYILK